ncbi:AAA family ATPase [Bacillus mycoides]|uniref:AAA family ATPase n=1 Tax=Bacillus mycoides TaxID=1405 RepID=UPI00273AFB40|nr:AAA family ATPase [Bacillus mycoides]
MNNKIGLQLKRFIVSNGNEIREIKLLEGLNVISGPTDTGKTYIYQCIKYILGSNSLPKPIPENKDFNHAYLEIKSLHKNLIFTLKRTLSTNKIYVYNCTFSEIKEHTEAIPVNTRGSKNLITTKLLEYSGIDTRVKIKTHIREHKFRNIAFRDFLHYSLVDEKEIIKDTSILTTGQYSSSTVELNLFYYLISGKHTSFLTYLSDQKISKKNNKSVKENSEPNNVLLEVYNETKNELNELEQNKIKNDVSYKDELLFVATEIENRTSKLKETFANIEKMKSKKLMNHELIKRFNLLEAQFDSDLHRLEFILEGGEILSKLAMENCPSCGKKLADECYKDHVDSNYKNHLVNSDVLFKSYYAEKKKISLNLNDLSLTIDNLLAENNSLIKEISLKENEYLLIRQEIEQELKPTQKSLTEKINKEVDSRLIQAKIDYLKNKLMKLEVQKLENIKINNLPEYNIASYENIGDLIDTRISELCEIMNTYLLKMKFPNLQENKQNVIFEPKNNDFIIGGKSRAVFGKGFRAIIYSVFLISLMKFCYKNKLPHAGFVLIDSPLTTFQEAEEVDPVDDIPKELKGRFINTFSKEKDSQIIILENKFPLKTKEINFIEFTKDENIGRYGFM